MAELKVRIVGVKEDSMVAVAKKLQEVTTIPSLTEARAEVEKIAAGGTLAITVRSEESRDHMTQVLVEAGATVEGEPPPIVVEPEEKPEEPVIVVTPEEAPEEEPETAGEEALQVGPEMATELIERLEQIAREAGAAAGGQAGAGAGAAAGEGAGAKAAVEHITANTETYRSNVAGPPGKDTDPEVSCAAAEKAAVDYVKKNPDAVRGFRGYKGSWVPAAIIAVILGLAAVGIAVLGVTVWRPSAEEILAADRTKAVSAIEESGQNEISQIQGAVQSVIASAKTEIRAEGDTQVARVQRAAPVKPGQGTERVQEPDKKTEPEKPGPDTGKKDEAAAGAITTQEQAADYYRKIKLPE